MKKVSGGSSERKLTFDDVTFEHNCILPARPNVVQQRGSGSENFVSPLLYSIVIWNDNPNTRKYFQSSDAVYKEIIRHTYSNYWYIIHPYCRFRFYWNSITSIMAYLLFLYIPITYAFYQDLRNHKTWSIAISIVLNFFCYLDLLFNFVTGYRNKHGNFIVLNQTSIIRNYIRGNFFFDFLSAFPFDLIYQYTDHQDQSSTEPIWRIIIFNVVFLLKFFRFASLNRAQNYFGDLMTKIKLSHVTKIIITLILRTVMFIQFSICAFKAVASSIFFYFYQLEQISPAIAELIVTSVPFHIKYLHILDFMIWALFDTSFGSDMEVYIPGKVITAGCMFISLAYNIYLLIQILNVMNIIRGPRTKYVEIMNQLGAYMQKKQFPMHLQQRLKFFYKKKFRRSYFKEEEILEIMSGIICDLRKDGHMIYLTKYCEKNCDEPLKREILINADKLFVERVKLFIDVPSSLVTSIAASCRKEQFLPNDLIVKAGTVGECMFFIASGSVCVTTTTGQELCHLEDGDYFGEIAFVLKNRKRIVNIIAIEFCEIYLLDYANLKKYTQVNDTIMEKLMETANKRMELTLEAEESFKKQLDEQFQSSRDSFEVN